MQSTSGNGDYDPSTRVYELLGVAESIASEADEDSPWTPELILTAMVLAELTEIRRAVLATREDLAPLAAKALPMLDNPVTGFLASRRKKQAANG